MLILYARTLSIIDCSWDRVTLHMIIRRADPTVCFCFVTLLSTYVSSLRLRLFPADWSNRAAVYVLFPTDKHRGPLIELFVARIDPQLNSTHFYKNVIEPEWCSIGFLWQHWHLQEWGLLFYWIKTIFGQLQCVAWNSLLCVFQIEPLGTTVLYKCANYKRHIPIDPTSSYATRISRIMQMRTVRAKWIQSQFINHHRNNFGVT